MSRKVSASVGHFRALLESILASADRPVSGRQKGSLRLRVEADPGDVE